ncbi:MAG: DUF4163 domain-containing protein, partial [Anaerovorax sp.]|nr:DUF4163 domain-containing protein [Anaerovorax sp.]
MQKSVVTVKNMVLEEKMEYDGTTVLVYRIEYPQFYSSFYIMALNDINRFYKTRALEYQYYVTTELYNMAVEQYKFNTANGFPMNPFAAYVAYEITYNSGCILSLYFDQYAYMGGAHGNTMRYAYTFDLQNGNKVKLSQLFGCYLNHRTYILNQVLEQIKK